MAHLPELSDDLGLLARVPDVEALQNEPAPDDVLRTVLQQHFVRLMLTSEAVSIIHRRSAFWALNKEAFDEKCYEKRNLSLFICRTFYF